MSVLQSEHPFPPSEPIYLAQPTQTTTALEPTCGPQFLDTLWDDETPQVEPTLLPVLGGKPLLYEGESHSIYGEGGSGKTWVGYLVAKQQAAAGRVVLIVDYESNARTALLRLRALGATQQDASRIAYWQFSDSMMPRTESGNAFAAWVDMHRPSFVLIDSVARALATAGFDENQNQHYNLWDAGVVAKLVAKRITVLCIDHTGHDGPEGRAKMRAIGASSKANRQSGACYHFEALTHWTRENDGMAKLTCMKDREGHRAKGSVAAEMHVRVSELGARLDIEFREPARSASGKVKLTALWKAVSKVLSEATEPMTMNSLNKELEAVGFKSAKRQSTGVIDEMRTEGYVSVEPGPNRSKLVSLLRPYVDEADLHEAADVRGF